MFRNNGRVGTESRDQDGIRRERKVVESASSESEPGTVGYEVGHRGHLRPSRKEQCTGTVSTWRVREYPSHRCYYRRNVPKGPLIYSIDQFHGSYGSDCVLSRNYSQPKRREVIKSTPVNVGVGLSKDAGVEGQ